MRSTLLFVIAFGLLFGCKEDDITPENRTLDVTLLQQYSWENRSEVEEQAVDQPVVYKYAKRITLLFNEIQLAHKTESYFLTKPEKMGNISFLPALDNGEFYGDYTVSAPDSILTFNFSYSNPVNNRWNAHVDTVNSSIKYKILQLDQRKLEIKPLSDMQIDGTHQSIIFKPSGK